MSEPELKPCPFCGNRDAKIIEEDYFYFVECDKCYARTTFDKKEDVTNLWNKRINPEFQWRPIETAPKDGNLILGCKEYGNGVFIIEFSKLIGNWRACGRYYEPTHWMPLPKPPRDKE